MERLIFQGLLNPIVCQCITAIDEAATDFLENIIGHVKDTSRPVNQMLALKVAKSIILTHLLVFEFFVVIHVLIIQLTFLNVTEHWNRNTDKWVVTAAKF